MKNIERRQIKWQLKEKARHIYSVYSTVRAFIILAAYFFGSTTKGPLSNFAPIL